MKRKPILQSHCKLSSKYNAHYINFLEFVIIITKVIQQNIKDVMLVTDESNRRLVDEAVSMNDALRRVLQSLEVAQNDLKNVFQIDFAAAKDEVDTHQYQHSGKFILLIKCLLVCSNRWI